MVNTAQYISEGFLLGLATGHLCLATCGPIYAPYLIQKEKNAKSGFRTVMEISVGRFISYALFGLIAGYLGLKISGINRQWFTSAAYIMFSVYLIVTAFRTRNHEKGCPMKKWSKFTEWPVVLGLVTGINFCPAFLIALTKAVDISGPVSGMLLFIAFFAGTNIFLLPFSFLGILGKQKMFRNIARIASVVVAVWFIGQAGVSTYSLIEKSRRPVITIMDDQPLYIVSMENGTANTLAQAMALHRTGPVYTINSIDQLPEQCYVFLGPEWLKKDRTLTEPIKKAGRFVVVLPKTLLAENAGHVAENIAAYLKQYHFLSNPKKGSLFVLPKAVMRTDPA